jgi:aspartyl/asparaginyl beta-hydroxylase (cupin superfamily)
MAAEDQTVTAAGLKESADRALRGADPAAAAELFRRALDLAPGRIDLWMGLAASRRAQGDAAASLAAIDGALGLDPRLVPALLMKGSLLESLGEIGPAVGVYAEALKLVPPRANLAEPTRRALAHARGVQERHQAELVARLRDAADLGAARTASDRRIEAFIEITAGRRRFFSQQPIQVFYPGLPVIEFYEREEFPWLEALEARTDAIRDEVLAVWEKGTQGLAPYVQLGPGEPLDRWADLNQSLNWSAFHLVKDGARASDNAARCPATMSALELLEQPDVPGRSPTALFSVLRPRTRIPPHTGLANTRLIVHLALIVPGACGFRVGGEVRPWREGEAFIFDDTIEHEAWNNSDKPRAVLICDVWNPRLSPEERAMIVRLTDVADRFNGVTPGEATP